MTSSQFAIVKDLAVTSPSATAVWQDFLITLPTMQDLSICYCKITEIKEKFLSRLMEYSSGISWSNLTMPILYLLYLINTICLVFWRYPLEDCTSIMRSCILVLFTLYLYLSSYIYEIIFVFFLLILSRQRSKSILDDFSLCSGDKILSYFLNLLLYQPT